MRSRFRTRVCALTALVLSAACGDTAPPSSGDAQSSTTAAVAPSRTLTLITGDRVIVEPDGRVRAEAGPGRAHVRFHTLRAGDETVVIPDDVAPRLASGQLDGDLFSVTRLIAEGYDDAQRADLPLIVTGATSAALRSAASGLVVDRAMPAVGAVAARQRKGAASALLAQLAPPQRIWLDRRYRPSLDHSVPQIGAPAAWESGITGAGVVVAVLDSGVDAAHPDLAGKIADAVTFVDDGQGATDVIGHGTHVASTIVGSGAASGGVFRGVAPDATVISGRVCDKNGCFGSAILAGMEWAVVEKGAKIVNLSLGGSDRPGVDPLEEAVNRLSAEHGALFVIAAGNLGVLGAGSISTPSSADAALSVGAIDRDEQLAAFSSRGPRRGDGAVKPEITAPGVGIVAARAAATPPTLGEPVGAHYLRLSGTSMATPHVAGAAALLLQRHPDWSGAQLKGALVASAQPNPALTGFEQGAGRVDVARAIRQELTAEPANLSFGRALWPHDDDPLLRRTVTYRNAGTAPITLAIRGALAHGGRPATEMLQLSAASITVPAGGTAELVVAIDTNGDRPDGAYSGTVVATAGDLRMTTLLSAEREVPSSELTLEVIDSNGNPTAGSGILLDDDFRFLRPPQTLRLPHREYTILLQPFSGEPANLLYPRFELSQRTTLALDARLARPVEIAVTGRPLELRSFETSYNDFARRNFLQSTGEEAFSTGHFGPASAPGEIHSFAIASFVPAGATDDRSVYVFGHRERDRFLTGMAATVAPEQLATVDARHRGDADRLYFKGVIGSLDDLPGLAGSASAFAAGALYRGPADRIEHYFGAGFKWASVIRQAREVEGEFVEDTDTGYTLVHYRAGRSVLETWNRAPFGPAFATHRGRVTAARAGDRMRLSPTMFSEVASPSRTGDARGTRRAALFRNGALLQEAIDTGGGLIDPFEVPPERATYRLEVDATRSTEIAELSTHVTSAWTFVSEHVAGDEVRRLPLPVLRFTPALDEKDRAPRALPLILPVAIERPEGAPTPAIAEVTVEASFDDGATWSPVFGAQFGARWLGVVLHRAKARYVSLRGRARDVDGNRVEQTIIRAYALAP